MAAAAIRRALAERSYMPEVTFTTGSALQKSALRQANDRLVLNVIRQNPSVSRADLVRITGMAPSSVTFIVKRLKREKLVYDDKPETRQPVGRRPTGLHLRAEARIALAIEIGPSGGRIITADLNGAPLVRKVVPWHPNHDVFFDRIHSAIRSLLHPLARGQVLGAGVALPGTIDRNSGRVIAAENLGWFGLDADALIRRNLDIPFYFENAAKLSALAEMWFPENHASPLQDFVSVIAGGGIGTGVIVNGQLLQGALSAGGEFGHISIDPDGRRCPCGNIGCWEQYASDRALARAYAEESGEPAAVDDPAQDIVAKARTGEPAALRALQTAARYIGMGFVNLVMALNPQAIIVGDYLAQGWDLMEETVWSILRSRVPPYALSALRISPSRHGAEVSLMGAVALVLTRFFNSFNHSVQAKPGSSVVMHRGL